MKFTEENLIFIVSQPRSGSTYLQNLLSNNSEVNTCSEPWLLLNFANQLKPNLIQAKFDNNATVDAFKDYLKKYPEINLNELQKEFLLNLYKPMSQGFSFIIDKTPRYWEILDEILKLFPKSKIIILKRNPIDVVKSMIITWEIKTLDKLNYFKRDLLIAPKKIQIFCDIHKENQNVYVIKYEDLIKEKTSHIKKIYDWIGIEYNDSVIDVSNNSKFKGKYGDPYQNSNQDYKIARKKSNKKELSKFFNNFMLGYNYYLGKDFLTKYGYELDNDNLKNTFSFKYFFHLKNKKLSLKKSIYWYLKKYYYAFRISK